MSLVYKWNKERRLISTGTEIADFIEAYKYRSIDLLFSTYKKNKEFSARNKWKKITANYNHFICTIQFWFCFTCKIYCLSRFGINMTLTSKGNKEKMKHIRKSVVCIEQISLWY